MTIAADIGCDIPAGRVSCAGALRRIHHLTQRLLGQNVGVAGGIVIDGDVQGPGCPAVDCAAGKKFVII